MNPCLRRALAAGAASALLVVTVAPVCADWTVFDPGNFAQNVLTAARELQQVNNEIQSLENQAQMLVNQARNLASLPFSALQQLEQSIAQTQQLLAQAQNIAYSVTAINQAFATTYPQSYSASTSAQQLVTDAQTRWQNALNGFQQAMQVQAGAVQNLDTTRTQIDALVSSSQSATGALQAAQSGNQLTALQTRSPTSPLSLHQWRGRRASTAPAMSRTTSRRRSSSRGSSAMPATSRSRSRCSIDAHPEHRVDLAQHRLRRCGSRNHGRGIAF